MKKRVLSLALVVAMIMPFVFIMPASAATSGTCGKNLTWALDDEGTLTISGTGDMTEYRKECSPWYNSTSIKSVILESDVTSIGSNAFYGCRSLTNITIPDSITSIGDSAFENCRSLTSITIPDSVTSIGDKAFSICNSLTSITLSDSVISIGNYTFNYCSKLRSINLPFPSILGYYYL